jgi:hypothetical protein
LDAVDNRFVAVWFATHALRLTTGSSIEISPDSEEQGWLYLIASTAGSKHLRYVDFRTAHNPLSSRPHIRRGISLAPLDPTEYGLRDFVVATVRFRTRNFTVAGPLFRGSSLIRAETISRAVVFRSCL